LSGISGFMTYPGIEYPGLFIIYAAPKDLAFTYLKEGPELHFIESALNSAV